MAFRVAILEFIHESNTFTIVPTEMKDFHASHFFQGDEIPANFGGTGTEVGGAMAVADDLGWDPVYVVAAHAEPSGPVTEAARLEITDAATRRLHDGGPYDGIFVALHGAMVSDNDQDGDSQFLRAVRAVAGPDIPLAVTLDLHANIADEFADLADIAVSFRTYPHVDMREVGIEACRLLHRAMQGEISPALEIQRPSMLVGCDDGRTTDGGPMCQLLEHANEMGMASDGILNISINAGFTDADVYAAGPSVLVTHDTGFRDIADKIAAQLCQEIWAFRDVWDRPIPLAECIAQIKALEPSDKPIVIADFSDNPGSGAYSDCTAVLAAMMEFGAENVALGALLDPEAVRILIAAGLGAEVTLELGGKADPSVGGGPLNVTGTVKAISDGAFHFEGPMFTGLPGTTGPSVCVHVQGVDVMVVSERMQMLDQNIFRVVGIEPAKKSILVVKSMQHFKGAFAPLASKIIVTDAGGLSSPDVTKRSYCRLRRPVFPFDTVDLE